MSQKNTKNKTPKSRQQPNVPVTNDPNFNLRGQSPGLNPINLQYHMVNPYSASFYQQHMPSPPSHPQMASPPPTQKNQTCYPCMASPPQQQNGVAFVVTTS